MFVLQINMHLDGIWTSQFVYLGQGKVACIT